MQFTITSTRWIEELQRRQEALTSQRVCARLRVSEDLAWWFFQEFGTATRADPYSKAQGIGNMPRDAEGRYLILPLYGSELRFPGADGEQVVTSKVWHPGVYPRAFVRAALDNIRIDFAKSVAPFVARGEMNLAQEMLLNEVMIRALEAITENINQELTGIRDDGRLGGQSAAEAFSEGAEVVATGSES